MTAPSYTCDLCGFQSKDRAAVLAHVTREHGVTDPVEVGAVDQADGLLTLRQGDQETVIDLGAWLADALAGREPGAAVTTRASAPGLVLTVTIEPGTVQAGQALRLWQAEPAELVRWLEAAIDDALLTLAIRAGARPAALAWSVTVQP